MGVFEPTFDPTNEKVYRFVDRFIDASDFYTLDVADYIGKPAAGADVDALEGILSEMADGRIAVHHAVTSHPSPFSSRLQWKRTNALMYAGGGKLIDTLGTRAGFTWIMLACRLWTR